jgi:hypothetical protein
MSDRQLAEYVGVSASFVGNRRKESEDAGESPPRPRPSRSGEGVNELHQQPDSGEAEYEKCPKCGGEEFYEDGTCESCVQDADSGEETDVQPADPGDPATILKCGIRDVVQSWLNDVTDSNPMLAACVLDNFATELREGQ